MKQVAFVENCGERSEVVTVGHNPYYEPSIVRSHVTIPSDDRPKFLDEFIYHKYWEHRTAVPSPRALLHGVLGEWLGSILLRLPIASYYS
jgi:hypothetical protein